jgi:3-(3-hydroxy-phenyl)propionate hydroxylase
MHILVAGAGPVGLAAALLAAARGLSVTVLEAEPESAPRPGSRAIFLHQASLDTLRMADPLLADSLVASGLTWSGKTTLWRGRSVFHRTYPAMPVSQAPFASLPQAWIESELRSACRRAGVRVLWKAPVTGVDAGPAHVDVTTADRAVHRAAYLIGADGARSAVRAAIGARLTGERADNTFVVIDLNDDLHHPLPSTRTFHYRHPVAGGRNVLLVPFRGGWRVDLQCHPGDDAGALTGDPARWLAPLLPAGHRADVTWASQYRFQQLVADRFVDASRRVLLAGEAAHLFAPFGARGLNSGIADAAAAVRAVSSSSGAAEGASAVGSAVASYGALRRAAALRNQAAAGQALRHLLARDPLTRLRQEMAAAAARRWPAAATWLDRAPYGPRDAGIPGSRY